ncbi:hypothetical protein GJ496_004990 [Pomphorhynchus laevis]|nr:hypothetical protein GJ496_004990 [Pomphorhynchus laevis]
MFRSPRRNDYSISLFSRKRDDKGRYKLQFSREPEFCHLTSFSKKPYLGHSLASVFLLKELYDSCSDDYGNELLWIDVTEKRDIFKNNNHDDIFDLMSNKYSESYASQYIMNYQDKQNGPNWSKISQDTRTLEDKIDINLAKVSANMYPSFGSVRKSTEELKQQEEQVKLLSLQLVQLSELNGKLENCPDILDHTLQRHHDILHHYSNEYDRIKAKLEHNLSVSSQPYSNLQSFFDPITSTRMSSSRQLDTMNEYPINTNSQALLSKEKSHIARSERMVDEQIEIAVSAHHSLISQRQNLSALTNRLHLIIINRFPQLQSILNRIKFKKLRNSYLISAVIVSCCVMLFWYVFLR